MKILSRIGLIAAVLAFAVTVMLPATATDATGVRFEKRTIHGPKANIPLKTEVAWTLEILLQSEGPWHDVLVTDTLQGEFEVDDFTVSETGLSTPSVVKIDDFGGSTEIEWRIDLFIPGGETGRLRLNISTREGGLTECGPVVLNKGAHLSYTDARTGEFVELDSNDVIIPEDPNCVPQEKDPGKLTIRKEKRMKFWHRVYQFPWPKGPSYFFPDIHFRICEGEVSDAKCDGKAVIEKAVITGPKPQNVMLPAGTYTVCEDEPNAPFSKRTDVVAGGPCKTVDLAAAGGAELLFVNCHPRQAYLCDSP